jgi:hypothetical protein
VATPPLGRPRKRFRPAGLVRYQPMVVGLATSRGGEARVRLARVIMRGTFKTALSQACGRGMVALCCENGMCVRYGPPSRS